MDLEFEAAAHVPCRLKTLRPIPGANLSTYCVTAHCEMVRMLGIEGPEPEQIAFHHTAANLPIAMKALLNFAAN